MGGLDVMPDVNMPGGETFVRQMQYGKGYYRDKLGVDVTAGWLIDTFGHHAQMPQLWPRRDTSRTGSSGESPNRITPRSSSGKGSTAHGSPPTTYLIVTHSCTDLRTTPRFLGVREAAIRQPGAQRAGAESGRSHRARRQRAGGTSARR